MRPFRELPPPGIPVTLPGCYCRLKSHAERNRLEAPTPVVAVQTPAGVRAIRTRLAGNFVNRSRAGGLTHFSA